MDAPVTKVTSIAVISTPSPLILSVGTTGNVVADILPADATNTGVMWSVTPAGIVTVDASGNVNAVAVGTATITATAQDGSGITGNCAVTVAPLPNTEWYTNNSSATSFNIGTADELAGLAQLVNDGITTFFGKTIALTSDIDLSDYGEGSPFNDGNGWIPIGQIGIVPSAIFRGIFDGDDKTISGLYINTPEYITDATNLGTGLFSHVNGGIIKNLSVKIGSGGITGHSCVGGIVGTIFLSTIENCSVIGSMVTGNNIEIGGVVGEVGGSSSVFNCYTTCAVNGSAHVGGVVGYLSSTGGSSSVTNCYATGTISGSSSTGRVGGVVGNVQNGSNVSNCVALNTSVICTSSNRGRIVGYNDSGTLTNNWAGNWMSGWGNKGASDLDGADITPADSEKIEIWWTTVAPDGPGWSSSVWTFVTGQLPKLW